MNRVNLRLSILSVIALIAGIAACSDSSNSAKSSAAFQSEEGILKYVPADTPYLIATPGDLADEVIEIFEPQMDAVLQAYHELMLVFLDPDLPDVVEDEEAADAAARYREEIRPIVEELGSLMSVKGLSEAGIDRESDVAFYGTGLLPVFRLSLTDGKLFEAALSRLEEKSRSEFSIADIDGHSYRYVENENVRFIIAIIDNHLVMSVTPSSLSDEQLKKVMGITLPTQNIAASGALQEMADTHGFVDYMIGFIDIERIVATFIDEPGGINAELLALAEADKMELSDVCKTEFRSMAGVMPRMLVGYTTLTAKEMATKAVVELRSDIATGVASLAGAVPGLGSEQGGLMSFGFSMDLLAAREFYSARLDALEADPYQCEFFAYLQDSVAQGREMLNQPVPPIVYGFEGFLAVIENLEGMDLQNNQPPTAVDMRLLVATDNAEGLLAMGSMFSPELASLELELDGQPVKLEIAQFAGPAAEEAYIAISENGIATSVGPGMESKLSAMLSATVTDPSPLFSFEVDAARYYSLIGASMASPGTGEYATPPEVQEVMQDLLGIFEEAFVRMYFDVNLTEQGIEMSSKVTLAE